MVAIKSRTFTSAAQSWYQRILHQEAKAAGISLDDLRELLCVTNADPDLIALPTTAFSGARIVTKLFIPALPVAIITYAKAVAPAKNAK
ncbi:MAG: hypothetical protein ACLP00_29950 [Terracidiphilus sp.]